MKDKNKYSQENRRERFERRVIVFMAIVTIAIYAFMVLYVTNRLLQKAIEQLEKEQGIKFEELMDADDYYNQEVKDSKADSQNQNSDSSSLVVNSTEEENFESDSLDLGN